MQVLANAKVTISDEKIEVTFGALSAVITSPTGIAQIQRTIAHTVLQEALYNQTDWEHSDRYGQSQQIAAAYVGKKAATRDYGVLGGLAAARTGGPDPLCQADASAEVGRAILASGNGAPKSLTET